MATLNQFDTCINRVLSSEGGYTADAKDPGNWTGGACGIGECKGTKFGIAANTYPHLDIKNLTRAQAIEIYRQDFWNAVFASALPNSVAFQVLDAAVNHGVETARRMLQRAAGVADDGRIGPVTLDALQSISESDLLLRFMAQRIDYYTRLAKFDTFGRGWMRRMAANLLYATQDN